MCSLTWHSRILLVSFKVKFSLHRNWQAYECRAGHFLLPFVLKINATEISPHVICLNYLVHDVTYNKQDLGHTVTLISKYSHFSYLNVLPGFSYWIQSWTWIAVQIYKTVIVLILHRNFFGLSLFQHQKLEKTIQMNSGLLLSALQYKYISDNRYCFLRIPIGYYWINDSIILQLIGEINVEVRLSNSLIANLTSNRILKNLCLRG